MTSASVRPSAAQQLLGLPRALRSARRGDSAVRRRLAALADDHDRLATTVEELRRTQDEHRFGVELLLGADTARTSRLPSRDSVLRLSAQVGAVTGSAKPYANVAAAYRTMVDLEQRGLGRIAGSALNVVGKLATVPLLEPPSAQVLEIGTLYGLFAGGVHRQLARKGLQPFITVVDPLASVQLQGGLQATPDPTGTPVSAAVVAHNLSLAGVPAEQLRVVEGFSTDAAVRQQVGDRRYGVVVVDGDHSYDGVAADLEWVHDLVEPGGVVVLDDYGDAAWPGVERAALEHLARRSGLTLLGTVSTSAYLRADLSGAGAHRDEPSGPGVPSDTGGMD